MCRTMQYTVCTVASLDALYFSLFFVVVYVFLFPACRVPVVWTCVTRSIVTVFEIPFFFIDGASI